MKPPSGKPLSEMGYLFFTRKTEDFAVFDRVAEAFKDVEDLSAKIDQAIQTDSA